MEDDEKAQSWLDLPDSLTDIILERLPLRGYLRFAAVCRRWRSIQRAHRLRHSPLPPPMAHPSPCLIPSLLGHDSLHLHCYSPFYPTLYPLQLPDSGSSHHQLCLASSHGWLLLLNVDSQAGYVPLWKQPFLLNPVSAACIQLPPLPHIADCSFTVAMSGPPSEPQCALLLLTNTDDIFLHLVNVDSHWTKFPLPRDETGIILQESIVSAAFVGDKFYCISTRFNFYVVHPFLPMPLAVLLEMGCSQLQPKLLLYQYLLVESDGEVLVVVVPASVSYVIEGFQVFRADFFGNVWGRVESLGDRALFVAEMGSFSLLAADVGCKKNCIYYTHWLGALHAEADLYEPWKVFEIFDLETGSMIYEQAVPDSAMKEDICHFDKYGLHWIMPRLDYIHPTEASSFERMVAEDA